MLKVVLGMDSNKFDLAVEKYTTDPRTGRPTKWYAALFEAPAFAMERIALAFYYSANKDNLSQEELQEYHDLRKEIDLSLRKEDLEYLVRVMPEKQKKYYKGLLALVPAEGGGVGQRDEARKMIDTYIS